MRPKDVLTKVELSPQYASVGSGMYTNLWGDDYPSLYSWLDLATGTKRNGIMFSLDLSMSGGDSFRILSISPSQEMDLANFAGTWLGPATVGFSSRSLTIHRTISLYCREFNVFVSDRSSDRV